MQQQPNPLLPRVARSQDVLPSEALQPSAASAAALHARAAATFAAPPRAFPALLAQYAALHGGKRRQLEGQRAFLQV